MCSHCIYCGCKQKEAQSTLKQRRKSDLIYLFSSVTITAYLTYHHSPDKIFLFLLIE